MERLKIHTRAEWDALPDADRVDWLARELLRRRQLDVIKASLDARIEKDNSIELSAYYAVLLAIVE